MPEGPDKYYNFENLAANEIYGVDYTVTSLLRPPSVVSSIAIHGGGIEVGTTELAREVAGINAQNFYTFESTKPAGQNGDLHVTSTHYDEPQALAMQGIVDYTVSFHGAAGTDPKSLMGGSDTVSRDSIASALNDAGFVAEVASTELNGNNPSNITNKNRRKKGVQIELTTKQRQMFFINEDWSRASRLARNFTDDFFKYVEIIAKVTSSWNITNIGSPHYNLNLAKGTDLMSDFDSWINSNFTTLEGVPAPTIIVTPDLPVVGAFEVGDRIYHTVTNSIYILVCNDINWGMWWRPVQAAMSPWANIPLTAVLNTGDWNIRFLSDRPAQIALDNMGNCHWRGVLGYIGAATLPKTSGFTVFKDLPFGFKPRETCNFPVGHQDFNIGATDFEGARLYINDADDGISIRAQGGNPAATNLTRFYINGCVQYAMGAGHYVLP